MDNAAIQNNFTFGIDIDIFIFKALIRKILYGKEIAACNLKILVSLKKKERLKKRAYTKVIIK